MKNIKEKIDLLVSNFIKETGIPGLAVGILENGEVVYVGGYGVMNVETEPLVTEDTFFHMASVSKPFVATGIMQLSEQGKLSLDDAVVKHLPYFKIRGEGYDTITIREMLSHISGMPDIYDYEWDKPQYDEEALERHARNAENLEIIEGLRGNFRYSNLAFEILGDLISKMSGMTFESYMKEKILNPIGMKDSSFFYKEVSKELLAAPHVLDVSSGYGAKVNGFYPYNRRHAPSSTLCSNIVEMLRWAQANLNRGTIDGIHILKEESYEELMKPAAPTGRVSYLSNIGLSWFLGEYKGTKVVSHSGGDTGFLSNLLLLPEKNAAIVWMTNSDFAAMKPVTEGLMDIVLGFDADEVKHSLALALVKALAVEGIEAADEKYRHIKESLKDKYYIEENEFNGLAYRLLRENRVKEAINILKFGIEELPLAANLYDSLGEMHMKNNDIELAIVNYEKALELNPMNQGAAKALSELKHN